MTIKNIKSSEKESEKHDFLTRIPKENFEKISEISKREGISINMIINDAITDWLEAV